MVNIRQLSPELAEKAKNELNEVANRIPQDIDTLRSWINKQLHLNARTDDQVLLTVLRGSKHSLEKAKQHIEYYYTLKTLVPDLFLYKPINDTVLHLSKLGFCYPIAKPLGADGPIVVITQYGRIDPQKYTLIDAVKYHIRVAELLRNEDDNLCIGGVIIVIDLTSMPLSLALQFEPFLVKKLVMCYTKGLPFRVKGLHCVNCPKPILPVLNAIRSVFPQKLKDRVFFHSSSESFHKVIPREYLPTELGGIFDVVQEVLKLWERKLRDSTHYFEEDMKYKTNEKLRPVNSVYPESLLGIDGSFRKLETD